MVCAYNKGFSCVIQIFDNIFHTVYMVISFHSAESLKDKAALESSGWLGYHVLPLWISFRVAVNGFPVEETLVKVFAVKYIGSFIDGVCMDYIRNTRMEGECLVLAALSLYFLFFIF